MVGGVYSGQQAEVGRYVDLTQCCCVVVFLFFLYLSQLLFLLPQSRQVKTPITKFRSPLSGANKLTFPKLAGVSTLSHLYLKYEFVL